MSKDQDSDFVNYLFRTDEAAVVLKCHLNIERSIDECLTKFLQNSEAITKWSFANKTQVLYSLGAIPEDLCTKLQWFNALRNRFAHRYGYVLTEEDVAYLQAFKDEDVEIPEGLSKFPRIRELMLIVRAMARMIGRMDGYSTVLLENPLLLRKLPPNLSSG